MPIQTVFAYRDDGLMHALSKWKPRRVECTYLPDHSDLPGRLYVVKFAHGPEGYACAISELICTQLLAAMGVRTLEPFFVSVSRSFADSYNLKLDIACKATPGLHFGTLLRTDVGNGPPPSLQHLNNPGELASVWVADTWVGNIDRAVDGNTLLSPAGKGKFHLIAADHSDCFGGTAQFCGRQFPESFLKMDRAKSIRFLQDAVGAAGGRRFLEGAIGRARSAVVRIESIVWSVPVDWWNGSSIQPKDVIAALHRRALELADIIKPNEWEVPDGFLI